LENLLRTRPETCRKVPGVSGPWKFPPPFPESPGAGVSGVKAGVSGVKLGQRLFFRGGYIKGSSRTRTPARAFPIEDLKMSHQNLDISQSVHPNSLILGGLKEKAPIYNFTKPFFISPSFT